MQDASKQMQSCQEINSVSKCRGYLRKVFVQNGKTNGEGRKGNNGNIYKKKKETDNAHRILNNEGNQ